MTDEATIELLKEVARVAPKEMNAVLVFNRDDEEPVGVRFTIDCGERYLWLDEDPLSSSEAAFAMLDAMERARRLCILAPCIEGYVCYDPAPLTPRVATIGSTRAEAVARALVEGFRDTA